MQRYATIDGLKSLPFPRGRGNCPCCGGVLIAKCGSIKAHHWAHEARTDCDPWAEPLGPWHLGWQDLVRPEAVEVPMGEHRADVVGNDGVVVELQHSAISTDEIRAREAFYDKMVWLFDATHRFRVVETGDRAFFSFGRTEHLLACTKPVYLDFGALVVEVDAFTTTFDKCSGFGTRRTREWFADRFLSDVRRPGVAAPLWANVGGLSVNPWESNCPYKTTKFPTVWVSHATSGTVTVPIGAPYLPLNYDWVHPKTGRRPVWGDVIEKYPELACGWEKDALKRMQQLLSGTPMILGGFLRIMPVPSDRIRVTTTVQGTEQLLNELDRHIGAGRVPVLKDETKRTILERARQYEIERYGRPLRAAVTAQPPLQPSLFD